MIRKLSVLKFVEENSVAHRTYQRPKIDIYIKTITKRSAYRKLLSTSLSTHSAEELLPTNKAFRVGIVVRNLTKFLTTTLLLNKNILSSTWWSAQDNLLHTTSSTWLLNNKLLSRLLLFSKLILKLLNTTSTTHCINLGTNR
uniref:Uncharacterized protein n=1 Tax=Meloidogyne incognita TaxID=6306 RepID=A0A914NHV8_MELIC